MVVKQAVITSIHKRSDDCHHRWVSCQDLRWSSRQDVLHRSSRILHKELTNETERMDIKELISVGLYFKVYIYRERVGGVTGNNGPPGRN